MDHVVETSRETIQQGSSSFSTAARLFPLETRESAWMLYAWCRYCDDVIDGQTLGFGMSPADAGTARARLATLTRLTEQAMGDTPPDDPVFMAFHRVVKRHDIPKRFPLELLEGFAMDIEGRRYETLADTLSYAYHVAGVVGVFLAIFMWKSKANRTRSMEEAIQVRAAQREIAIKEGRAAELVRQADARQEDIDEARAEIAAAKKRALEIYQGESLEGKTDEEIAIIFTASGL